MDEMETLLNAVREDDGDVVRNLVGDAPELLRKKESVEGQGRGPSPILEALYRGALHALDALLEFEPSLGVHEAAALGETDRLREGLDADPEQLSRFSDDGWTPLHLACFFGRREATRLLLDRGAPLEVISRNATANRPLHAALAGRAGREVVEALLERGADVAARADGGYTPLHLAASRGGADIVELLLSHGADSIAQADDGTTSAAIAEERGHLEVAQQLR